MTGTPSSPYLYKSYADLSWKYLGQTVAQVLVVEFDVNHADGLDMVITDPYTPPKINFPLRAGTLNLPYQESMPGVETL